MINSILCILLGFIAGYLSKQDPRDSKGRFKRKKWWQK